jgi:predicted  nucleic acid-binding Zn-ribbon protein
LPSPDFPVEFRYQTGAGGNRPETSTPIGGKPMTSTLNFNRIADLETRIDDIENGIADDREELRSIVYRLESLDPEIFGKSELHDEYDVVESRVNAADEMIADLEDEIAKLRNS